MEVAMVAVVLVDLVEEEAVVAVVVAEVEGSTLVTLVDTSPQRNGGTLLLNREPR